MNNISITKIIDYVGLFAPIILCILTIIIIFNKTTYLLFFIVGFILNNILNILLKLAIKEPRPINDTLLIKAGTANGKRYNFDKYGMPSGHAQMCGFVLAYILLVLNNVYVTTLYIIITIISLYQRYKYKNHSILQLIVGLFIGLLVGYIVYNIATKQLKGNIKPKRDDNARNN
jgi:membrane-associated phospholipid phosphatase